MVAMWITEEVADADLHDERLNRRLGLVLDQLGSSIHLSIPAACGGHSETTAAYRFFDNPKVDFESVLQPHIEATFRRMESHDTVLLIQDTTEIDLTRPEKQVEGAGKLDGRKRVGMLLHPLMACLPDGTPLGTVAAEAWTRDDDQPGIAKQTRAERQKTPIEEKESHRWLEGIRESQYIASQIPDTRFICVADSEADIYEVIEQASSRAKDFSSCGWIVRSCQSRAVLEPEASRGTIREALIGKHVLKVDTVQVRGRRQLLSTEKRRRKQSREDRQAKVHIRAGEVTLRPPYRPDRKLSKVTINAVLVTEEDCPSGETPIEWLLLTSEPIETLAEVESIIRNYQVRWMIEIYFRTLKSCCRVEHRRFEHINRMLPVLGIYMILGWRALYLCRLARQDHDRKCDEVFEESEWKSVIHFTTGKPATQPPSLRELIRIIGQLGGYNNRNRKDEPGPLTTCLGLQRVHDIATCWLTFGPGSVT